MDILVRGSLPNETIKKDDGRSTTPAETILRIQIFGGFILPRCTVKVLGGWVENLIGIYPSIKYDLSNAELNIAGCVMRIQIIFLFKNYAPILYICMLYC